MQCRISTPDIADVAFEMLDVDRIAANDGGVETSICFGHVFTEIVGACVLRQVGFRSVEGGEKGLDGFFIGFLSSMLRLTRGLLGRKSW